MKIKIDVNNKGAVKFSLITIIGAAFIVGIFLKSAPKSIKFAKA